MKKPKPKKIEQHLDVFIWLAVKRMPNMVGSAPAYTFKLKGKKTKNARIVFKEAVPAKQP